MLCCDSALSETDTWNFHPFYCEKKCFSTASKTFFPLSYHLIKDTYKWSDWKRKCLHHFHSFTSGKDTGLKAMTVVLFIWGGNYSLLHLFIWNAPGALWWIREKHSNFHHTCTFSNPKETYLRAARCPKDDLYLGEQLRPLLSIHSLAQSLRARVCDVVNSIKNITSSQIPSCNQQNCLCWGRRTKTWPALTLMHAPGKISTCAKPPNLYWLILLNCHSVLQAVNGFNYS